MNWTEEKDFEYRKELENLYCYDFNNKKIKRNENIALISIILLYLLLIVGLTLTHM